MSTVVLHGLEAAGHKGRRSQDKVVCWGTNTGYLFARTVTHVSRLHGPYGSRMPLIGPSTLYIHRLSLLKYGKLSPCNPPPGFRGFFEGLTLARHLLVGVLFFFSFSLPFISRSRAVRCGGLFEISSNAVCMLVNEINGSSWNIRCVVTRFEACSKN